MIVIANAKRSGIRFLYKVHGKDKFSAVSDVILGMNTVEPIFSPVKITAFILYLYKFFIFNLVPLHSPLHKFRNNMTWVLIFNSNSCGGSPSLIHSAFLLKYLDICFYQFDLLLHT